jgi:uncharacterized protein YkwD
MKKQKRQYGKAILAILMVILFTGVSRAAFIALRDSEFDIAAVFPALVTVLTNNLRIAQHQGALVENPLLDRAAQAKADDMAAKSYFAHVSPDGSQPWDWIARAGYVYEYAGENLAVNYEDSNDVVNAWAASPMHRYNLLRPQYTEIGVATSSGIYRGRTALFVVQMFANPLR